MTHAEMRRMRTEAILSATKELILQQGTGANLMTSIAQKSGISRQRLYQYYPNLESLMVALLADTADKIYGQEYALFSQFMNVRPVTDALLRCLEADLDFLCRDDGEIRDNLMLLCLLDVHQTKNPTFVQRNQLAEVIQAPQKLLQSLIRIGQRDGIIRTDMSAESMAYVATQAVFSYANRVQMRRADPNSENFSGKDVSRALVRGILQLFQGIEND